MIVEVFLHTRTDRLIAMARAAIAVFAIAAIWIDRSQPAIAPGFTYWLLAAYIVFAAVIILASWRDRVWSAEIALGSHLVDLSVFSTLMFLTEGPTSPFFLLFTFSLLSASFRWRWKGALWTAVAVLILLIFIGAVYRGLGLPLEVDRFVIRCAHIVVIGAMLVYFGYRQQLMADEAARLAAWQPGLAVGPDSRSLLGACLAHVANVFAAPRVVLVLETQQEPWANALVWEDDTFHQNRLTGGTLETIVPGDLAESGFIRRATGDVLVADGRGRLSAWSATQLGSALPGYGLERVLSVPIHSQYATGRLFVADKDDFAREELTLASLVAVQIGALLDRMQVIEAAQQTATAEQRLRLARDLHDGILQTLAGTALQLESIKRLAAQDPASLPAKINEMQSWLLNEQREIRRFIGKLRPPGAWARSGSAPVHSDLASLARALERQWGVAIGLPAEAADLAWPANIEFHVRHILREAVANAVRHGGASDIDVQAELGERRLKLEIADNGTGLPVQGQFDEHQCAQARIGPRSLRERIAGLGGSLVIDSTPTGVTLSIELPLTNADAPRQRRG